LERGTLKNNEIKILGAWDAQEYRNKDSWSEERSKI